MFDEFAILAYLRYFLGCLQPHLTEAKEAKSIKDDLAAGVFIGGLSAKDTFI